MARIFAGSLLILGILLLTGGALATAVVMGELRQQGMNLLLGMIALDVTAVIMIAVGIYLRRTLKPTDRRWEETETQRLGTKHLMNEEAYFVLFRPEIKGTDGEHSLLQISVETTTDGVWYIAKKNGFDRLCERLGVAVKISTGDSKFDEACYVRSATPAFAKAYFADPEKRRAVQELRQAGFTEIKMERRRISVAQIGFDPKRHNQSEVATDAAERLLILSHHHPEPKPEFNARCLPTPMKHIVACWLFLIVFAAMFFTSAWYLFPPVWMGELYRMAAIVYILGFPTFVFLTARLFRGTTYSHKSWGWLMVASFILFPLGSIGTPLVLNGLLDQSLPTRRSLPILDVIEKPGGNQMEYHAVCASWRDPAQSLHIKLSFADQHRIMKGQTDVIVTTHPGWLGIEWLEKSYVNGP